MLIINAPDVNPERFFVLFSYMCVFKFPVN